LTTPLLSVEGGHVTTQRLTRDPQLKKPAQLDAGSAVGRGGVADTPLTFESHIRGLFEQQDGQVPHTRDVTSKEASADRVRVALGRFRVQSRMAADIGADAGDRECAVLNNSAVDPRAGFACASA
jgi:hypothetical protein